MHNFIEYGDALPLVAVAVAVAPVRLRSRRGAHGHISIAIRSSSASSMRSKLHGFILITCSERPVGWSWGISLPPRTNHCMTKSRASACDLPAGVPNCFLHFVVLAAANSAALEWHAHVAPQPVCTPRLKIGAICQGVVAEARGHFSPRFALATRSKAAPGGQHLRCLAALAQGQPQPQPLQMIQRLLQQRRYRRLAAVVRCQTQLLLLPLLLHRQYRGLARGRQDGLPRQVRRPSHTDSLRLLPTADLPPSSVPRPTPTCPTHPTPPHTTPP